MCTGNFRIRITIAFASIQILLFAHTLTAQEKQFIPQPVTPESQFLELVDLESDLDKQMTLMQLFLAQFPKYEAVGAVYSQMQSNCVKLGRFDEALQFGDKLLQIDSEDTEALKLNAEAALGKKDVAQAKKWADRLASLTQTEPSGTVTATSTIRSPYVEGAENDAAGPTLAPDQLTPRARARLEAGMFNRALEESDGKKQLELLDQFAKTFPQSPHMNKVVYLNFLAYRKLNDDRRALAIAETMLAKDQTREDVLFFVLANYFAEKRNLDKVLSYSTMLLDLINGKPKPDNISDADWAKEKAMITQQTHWMTANTYMQQGKWAAADKEIRVTLPFVSGNTTMTAGLLTSLAWANYQLKNIPEALKLYQQISGLGPEYQATAAQSIASIKNEYALQ
jgi:tetratricopeptide (TPR) repeat protein